MLTMLVACPGDCGEALDMPTSEHGWSVEGSLHVCPVLGPMPNPFDPPALMQWMSGLLAPSLTAEEATSTVDVVETPPKKRNYVHVPFDSTECPKEGCSVDGKVPGVRRHVGFMHKDEEAELLAKMPPNRTIDGLTAAFEKDNQLADQVISRLGLRERFPAEADAWTWEDAAVAVLNHVEER